MGASISSTHDFMRPDNGRELLMRELANNWRPARILV
jgi:hypothetical protein